MSPQPFADSLNRVMSSKPFLPRINLIFWPSHTLIKNSWDLERMMKGLHFCMMIARWDIISQDSCFRSTIFYLIKELTNILILWWSLLPHLVFSPVSEDSISNMNANRVYLYGLLGSKTDGRRGNERIIFPSFVIFRMIAYPFSPFLPSSPNQIHNYVCLGVREMEGVKRRQSYLSIFNLLFQRISLHSLSFPFITPMQT